MTRAKEHGANGYSDEEWEVYRKARTTEEYSAVDYVQACRLRTNVAQRFGRLLDSGCVVATPAQLVTAPRVSDCEAVFDGQARPLVPTLIRPLVPFSLSGHPAVSIPIGRGEVSGLPIGLQLVGGYHRDHDLLALSARILAAVGWEGGLPARSRAPKLL